MWITEYSRLKQEYQQALTPFSTDLYFILLQINSPHSRFLVILRVVHSSNWMSNINWAMKEIHLVVWKNLLLKRWRLFVREFVFRPDGNLWCVLDHPGHSPGNMTKKSIKRHKISNVQCGRSVRMIEKCLLKMYGWPICCANYLQPKSELRTKVVIHFNAHS